MVKHHQHCLALITAGIIALVAVTLIGCKPSGTAGPTFTVETVEVENLASEGEDVYLVFTNPSTTNTAPAAPSIHTSIAHSAETANGLIPALSQPTNSGVVDARLWQSADFPAFRSGESSSFSRLALPVPEVSPVSLPTDDTVGTTDTFSGGSGLNDGTIAATCRAIVNEDGRTLSIYVADSAWHDGGTDTNLITGPMLTALADRFLDSGSDNDIWDWTTDIFGAPWGSHDYSNIIESWHRNYITILLYDIDGDGDESTGSKIVGYFDPGDSFTDLSWSDQRLIFAMDSALYADDGSDDIWSETDYWPQEVFSTLTHEFQHMIHFYQKQVNLSAPESETWLNEMCSLVAEDLLAAKMGIPGPRGRTPADAGTAGAPGNCESTRLSGFNLRVHNSLTNWPPFNSSENPLPYYASSYAFGAYIARNFGGAELLRNIVQNAYTDEHAVTQAIYQTTNEPFDEKLFGRLLTDWAIATFTSDGTAADDTYNRGIAVTSSVSSITYSLGSINLYNYDNIVDADPDPITVDGPIPFSVVGGGWNTGGLSNPGPASNTVILVGTNLSGSHSWTVEVPIGMTVTYFTR